MADEVVEKIKSKFGDAIIDVFEKSPKRTYITVAPAHLPDVAEYVFKDLGARFAIASGMHMEHGFEILYHLSLIHI